MPTTFHEFFDTELATVLAALRHWQATVPESDRAAWPYFCDVPPLDNAGVDRICAEINGEEIDDGEDE